MFLGRKAWLPVRYGAGWESQSILHPLRVAGS